MSLIYANGLLEVINVGGRQDLEHIRTDDMCLMIAIATATFSPLVPRPSRPLLQFLTCFYYFKCQFSLLVVCRGR